jgi:hypothetical protein
MHPSERLLFALLTGFALMLVVNEGTWPLSRHYDTPAMIYIRAHFVVLPLLAITLVIAGTAVLLTLRWRAWKGASAAILAGTAYLIVLYFWPLPWLYF